MSIDVTLFCLDFKEHRVDLQIEYAPACLGDLVVETVQFLMHCGIEAGCCARLAVDDDERCRCCGWSRGLSTWSRLRNWLRLRRCGGVWVTHRSSTFCGQRPSDKPQTND